MFAAMTASVNPNHGFCRDCLTLQRDEDRRCTQCGSPRLLRHPELYRLHLAHIDCDAFYAAIEKRDNPALKDKPVIIGGGKRGVVSTACYIARIHGVRSAMPMYKALAACPEAVVVKPSMEKYARVGREVRAMMQATTPQVEPISIDEAFLDLAGTERLHGRPPALVLGQFALDVEREIGITVSVGLSYCKFLAKVASDFRKPRGFSVIGEAEAVAFLAEQPVTLIWGVGNAFAATLDRDGIRTIGQLAADGARRADAPLRHDGRQALPPLPRPGPARRASRPRRKEHLGRDHVRYRPCVLGRSRSDPSRPLGKGLGSVEEIRHCRADRRSQTEDCSTSRSAPGTGSSAIRRGWRIASFRPDCSFWKRRRTAQNTACSGSA